MTKKTTIEMEAIEHCARELAQARRALEADVRNAEEALGEVRAKWGDVLKAQAHRVAELQDELIGYVEQCPDLFEKPQSQEFDGVKVGWRKSKGRLELPETEKLLKKIGEVLTRSQKEAVVKVKVTILKGQLARLSGEILKKLGINITGAGPEPFVSFPKSDIAGQVDWWLKPLPSSDEEA